MYKKIIKLYKKESVFLFASSLLIGLVELFSFSIIPPALYLSINPQGFVENFSSYITISIDNKYIGYIIPLILIGGFLFKYLIVRILTKYQFSVLSRKQIHVTGVIYNGILNEEFNFFNTINSGHLVKILNNDAGDFRKYSITLVNLFTEISIGASILVVLVLQSWILTLFLLLIVGFGGWVFEFSKRDKIKKLSVDRNNVQKKTFKLLTSTFYGIREIKITRTENFFYNLFNSKIKYFYDYNDKIEVETVNSKTSIELTFIFFLSVLVFASSVILEPKFFSGYSLLLFLIASLRLLPTLNRITSSIVLLKGLFVVVDNLITLYDKYFFKKNTQIKTNEYKFCASIKILNLSFKYPSKDKFVLNNVNANIISGDIVGVRGISGSGKSTFVNILVNLFQPSSGEICYLDLTGGVLDFRKCKISYMAQETIILDTNLRENVAFGISSNLISDQDVIIALKLAKLGDLLDNMSIYDSLGERGLTLSGGQRQRLSIARLFYSKGDIIILDEITSGLDKKTESEIFHNILSYNRDKIVIVISHNPEIWTLCNKFINL